MNISRTNSTTIDWNIPVVAASSSSSAASASSSVSNAVQQKTKGPARGVDHVNKIAENQIFTRSQVSPRVQIGDFRISGKKEDGVEPGFVAKKEWKTSDTMKLDTPGKKIRDCALTFLDEKVSPEGKAKIQWEMAMANVPLSAILKKYGLEVAGRRYVMDHILKFQKNHYFKLLYKAVDNLMKTKPEPEQTMAISLKQSRSKFGYVIGAIFYYHKMISQQKLNVDAINEAVANDVYCAAGIRSQKLRLFPWVNDNDGHLNFMLHSTEARGDEGEKCHDFFGKIEGESLACNKVGPEAKFDEMELAKLGWMMKILGDWDKIGSQGKNLMYFIDDENVAHIINIDPGKAFSEEMESTNIKVDGSLTNPKKFRNVAMLEDIPLSTRVKALKEILDRQKDMLQCFGHYINFFENNFIPLFVEGYRKYMMKNFTLDSRNIPEIADIAGKAKDHYISKLVETQSRLENRLESVKQVMQERLQVYRLSENRTYLDIIDQLEKLTSHTMESERLEHLRIDPNKQRAWIYNSGCEQFELIADDSTIHRVKYKLEAFFSYHKYPLFSLNVSSNRLILKFLRKRDLATAHQNVVDQLLTKEKITSFKNQYHDLTTQGKKWVYTTIQRFIT